MKFALALALLILLVANSGCRPGAVRAARPVVKRVAPELAKKLFGSDRATRYVLPVSPQRPPYGIKGSPRQVLPWHSRRTLPWHLPSSGVEELRGLRVEGTPKGPRFDHSKRSNWLDEAEGLGDALMEAPGRIEDLRKWHDILAPDDNSQSSNGRTVEGRRRTSQQS